MAGNLVLIDGDILVYRVAFSCQKKDPITHEVVVESAGIARARCDEMIKQIIDNTEATSCMGWLTDGKENFRNKVAVTTPYKGGRIMEKPVHYDMLREYLEVVHDYEMCTTQEADDAIGITHMDMTDGNVKAPVIIASIDKDLLMIPGRHYNISKQETCFVNSEQAMKNFFLQVLTGDRTDNIVGLKGIGPVKAEKILDGCETFGKLSNAAHQAYHKVYGDQSLKLIDETAELLWIRRIAGVKFGWGHVNDVYELYHGGTK